MPVDLYVGGAEHAVLHLLYARFWHKVLYDIGVVHTKEPFQSLVSQGMILGETEYSVFRNALGEYCEAGTEGALMCGKGHDVVQPVPVLCMLPKAQSCINGCVSAKLSAPVLR